MKENLSKSWDWSELSENPAISLKEIDDNPTLLWDYRNVCSNPNLTIHWIKSQYSKQSKLLHWFNISKNPAILLKDVIENPDLPWNYFNLSQNPNITYEYVKSNLQRNWDWYFISRNPGITLQNIIDNLDIMSDNVLTNPNITFEYIKNRKNDDYTWYYLSRNKFKKHPELIFLKTKILQYWYRIWKNKKLKRLLKSYLIKDLISIILDY